MTKKTRKFAVVFRKCFQVDFEVTASCVNKAESLARDLLEGEQNLDGWFIDYTQDLGSQEVYYPDFNRGDDT